MLIEAGQTLFQFFHQPAGKTFCLGDCELAEFRAAASDCAAPECGAANAQSKCIQFLGQTLSITLGNVHDKQVLHVGRAQFAGGETIGKIGGSPHLIRSDSPAEHRRSHVAVPRLPLRVNSHVVAINIRGWRFLNRGIELKSNAPLQFLQKAPSCPSVPQEKKLQPCPLAVFAQHIRVAKQFSNPLKGRKHLMPADERVQSRPQIGLGGEAPGNSQREPHLGRAAHHTSNRGQPNIVNLGIGTPHTASRDRNLELAGKVVKVTTPRQHSRRFERQRRSITNLVRVHACNGTAGNIARDIAAGTGRVQSRLSERVEQFWERLDSHPVQLNVLAHRDVGDSASVAAGEVRDRTQLLTPAPSPWE